MQLKPQDVLVTLKLALRDTHHEDEVQALGEVIGLWEKYPHLTYASLGSSLGMSASEVHQAVRRARAAGFLTPDPEAPESRRVLRYKVNRRALTDFIIHGLRYVFVPDRGGEVQGIPTAYAAPPLNLQIVSSGRAPPVWPSIKGKIRGWSVTPLYRSAPDAALKDQELYELLALTDALRIGKARERQLAEAELRKRLSP